jgi:hypothetical protein
MAAESASKAIPAGFGAPYVLYRPSRSLGLVGIALLVTGLVLLTLAYELLLPCIAGVIGGGLLVLGFALAFDLVKTPYMVCPQGVLYYGSRRWHACHWSEVKAIWRWTTINYHEPTLSYDQDYSCEILCQDGTRLKLKHIREEELIKWVEHKVYRSLIPKTQAQWDAGESVWFGVVSLSPVGIHWRKEVLPWGDVESVKPERNDNDIVIRQKGQFVWKELDGLAIPNSALFFQLVREKVRRKTAESGDIREP